MEEYKEKAKEIMVIGHKNPDTDSICSAICYADLKNKITGTDNYVPKRAGHLNEETHFVLNRFGVEAPEYIKDVRPQVMNIEIRHTEGIDREISVRNAWKLMDSLNVVTLPKTIDNDLVGTDVSFGFQSAVDIATNTIDWLSYVYHYLPILQDNQALTPYMCASLPQPCPYHSHQVH